MVKTEIILEIKRKQHQCLDKGIDLDNLNKYLSVKYKLNKKQIEYILERI
jgi:hypothetical protein